MTEQGLDALLVLASSSTDPDLAPFVGDAHLGPTLALVLPDDALRLAPLSPMEREEAEHTGHLLVGAEELDIADAVAGSTSRGDLLAILSERLLASVGLDSGSLAVAGTSGVGEAVECCHRLSGRGWGITSGQGALAGARKVKSPRELEAARHAARGACAAFRRLAELLAASTPVDEELWLEGEPVTVRRLRAEVALTLAAEALEQPRGSILAPGEEGAVPHNAGTPDRRLRVGESLVVDLFPKGLLFADCTRTFCVGEAPEGLVNAHGAVLEALRWARRECRPGRRGWTLQQGVCEILSRFGVPTQIDSPGTERGYVHGLGHGVGYELHELPHFRQAVDSGGCLEAGDLVTLEPGIYEPDAGYAVRLEDLVVVGDPLEDLTPLPYDLDPKRW